LFEFSPPRSTDLLTGPARDAVVFAARDGAGRRRYALLSHNEVETMVDVQAGMLRILGMKPDDCLLNMLGSSALDPMADLVNRAVERVGSLLLPVGLADFAEIADWIERFHVTCVIGRSDALMALAQWLHQRTRPTGVSRVLFAGDDLTPAGRGFIESAFSRATLRRLWFGTRDAGPIGYSCELAAPGTYHLLEDYQLLEIVDPLTGQLLPAETVGTMVVSNLNRRLMPLLRLNIGQRGQFLAHRCACGRQDRLFRVVDAWETEETVAVPLPLRGLDFWGELERYPSLSRDYLLESTGHGWRLRIEARLDPMTASERAETALASLRAVLQTKLRQLPGGAASQFDVVLEPPGALPRDAAGALVRPPVLAASPTA